TDLISQVFRYPENIFHHTCRIFEYVAVYSLEHIGQLVSIFSRYVHCVSFIDVSCPKRLHIAAPVSKSECVNGVFQIAVVRPVDLPSRGKDYFARFYFLSGSDRTVCLYHTSKAHMCST